MTIPEIIDVMQETFPITFPCKPAPKVPLKLGIDKGLYWWAEGEGITKEEVDKALELWCTGRRYWLALATNPFRYGLMGYKVGSVSIEHANYARGLVKHWYTVRHRKSEISSILCKEFIRFTNTLRES